MTDWLITLLFVLGLLAVGWPWVSVLCGERVPGPTRAAIGYLVGVAATTLGMLGLAFLHVPLYRQYVVATMLLIGGSGALLTRLTRFQRLPPAPRPSPGRAIYALPGIVIAAAPLLAGLVRIRRLGSPSQIDYVREWGIKGVYVAYHHNLLFTRVAREFRYYPLLVPNLYAANYLMIGHVNDRVIRLPILVFALALAVIVWWFARLMMPPAAAGAAVALAIGTPELLIHFSRGLADLETAVFLTLAVLAAYRWVLDDDSRYAALTGVAAGGAAWCKLEGSLTGFVIIATAILLRRRRGGVAACLTWFALFVIPWQVFIGIHNLGFSHRHFATVYLHLGWIVREVADVLVSPTHWGIFWPLTLLTIVLTTPFWWKTRLAVLVWLTVPNLVFTMGAYVTHYRAGHAGSIAATAPRLYLHLAPAVAVTAAGAVALAWAHLRPEEGQSGRAAQRLPSSSPVSAAPPS